MNIKMLIARLMLVSTALCGAHAVCAQPDPASPPATETALAPAHNPQVVAFVDYQFPMADTDADGNLTATEFTAWVGTLKAAEMEKAGQAADPAVVRAYAYNALLVADKDKNRALSKEELVVFFGG
jgi:hypothetical protein